MKIVILTTGLRRLPNSSGLVRARFCKRVLRIDSSFFLVLVLVFLLSIAAGNEVEIYVGRYFFCGGGRGEGGKLADLSLTAETRKNKHKQIN